MRKLLLVLIIALIGVRGWGQIVLSYGIDTTVCKNITAKLQAEVSATITGYLWSSKKLGLIGGCNGQNTCIQNINLSDTFKVKFNRSGIGDSAEFKIRIFNPFTVDFTFIPDNNCSNFPVAFINTSNPAGLASLWNFGDQSTPSTSPIYSPTHIFIGSPGNSTHSYNVWLVVQDGNGCKDSIQHSVIRRELPDTSLKSPGHQITLDSTTYFYGDNCMPNTNTSFNINLNNNTSTRQDSGYGIIWGDLSNLDIYPPPFSSANHVYSIGNFPLQFIVLGKNGCIDTGRYVVFTQGRPNISSIGGIVDLCSKDTFQIPINGTVNNSNLTTYIISINDNSPNVEYAHLPPPTHPHVFLVSSCTNSDTYFTAKLTAINPCTGPTGAFTTVGPIYVSDKPIANFSINPQDTVCVNQIVTLTYTGNSGLAVSTTQNCESGNFVWTVPVIPLTGNPGIDNSHNSDPTTWISGTQSITFNFPAPGLYYASVKNGSSIRCGLDSLIKPICVNPLPQITFTVDNTVGCAPLTLHTITSNNQPTCGSNTYEWKVSSYSSLSGCVPQKDSIHFVSPTTSSSMNPIIQLVNPGSYRVFCTMYSPGRACHDTFSLPIFVKGKPNIDSLIKLTVPCPGDTIYPAAIMKCLLDPITYSWSFPGATSAANTNINPAGPVVYPIGSFTYELLASNTCGVDSQNASMVITPPATIQPVGNDTVCAGDSVPLHLLMSIQPGAALSWLHTNTAAGLAIAGANNDTIPGYIAYNNVGTTISDTFFIKLAPTSCDTLGQRDTFVVIINPFIIMNERDTVCEHNLPFHWKDTLIMDAGIYTHIGINTTGCDTLYTLHLDTIATVHQAIEKDTICPGQFPYLWVGHYTINTPGPHLDTTYSTDSCYIIWTLQLAVKDTVPKNYTYHVCKNDLPFQWNGLNYTTDTTFCYDSTTLAGCNYHICLTLKVHGTDTGTMHKTICAKDAPYIWHGVSHSASGTYPVLLIDSSQYGCDSLDVLDLYVITPTIIPTNLTICAHDAPYTWPVNGRNYSISTKDTSIISHPGSGCDSIISTLDLIVNSDDPIIDTSATVCENKCLVWRGKTFCPVPGQTAGMLYDTAYNSNNCYAIKRLTINVSDSSLKVVFVNVCRNKLPYIWHNKPPYYTDTVDALIVGPNHAGCDSTEVLNLTIKDTSATYDSAINVCPVSVPFTWENLRLDHNVDTFKVFAGQNYLACDSIKHFKFRIDPDTLGHDTLFACYETAFFWNGIYCPVSGDYQVWLRNRRNCDSLAMLHLTKFPKADTIINLLACRDTLPFVWKGDTIRGAGTYTVVLHNASIHNTRIGILKCDSTLTLSVLVGDVYNISFTRSICISQLPYFWPPYTFTSAGTKTATYQSIYGCDSTVTYILETDTIIKSSKTIKICPHELPFQYRGKVYPAPGTYQIQISHIPCDSLETLTLDTSAQTYAYKSDSVCSGHWPYQYGNHYYYGPGTYIDIDSATAPCHKVTTLTLSQYFLGYNAYINVCPWQLPYKWKDSVFSAGGVYQVPIHGTTYCDTIATLYLTVGPVTIYNYQLAKCPSQVPYTWDGHVLTHDTAFRDTSSLCVIKNYSFHVDAYLRDTLADSTCYNLLPYHWRSKRYNASGTYYDTTHLSPGCDSAHVLTLSVYNISRSDTAATICYKATPFTWHGKVFNSSALDSVILKNVHNCDSVVRLTLRVIVADTIPVKKTICASSLPYNFNGHTFTTAGHYDTVMVSSVNPVCDSIIHRLILDTTHALMLPPPTGNSIVCQGGDIHLYETTLAGATYYWYANGYSSTQQNPVRNNATVTMTGNYFSEVSLNGCKRTDSIHVTVITKAIGGHTNSNAGVCPGNNSDTIRLTGYDGTIVRWETLMPPATMWLPVSPFNNNASQPYSNLAQNTWYRVVIVKAPCDTVYSDTTKITMLPGSNNAYAGGDTTLCNATSFILAGNMPINNGQGTWTQVPNAPTVVFSNIHANNATVSNLVPDTIRLVWSITSTGGCSSTSDTITIINRPPVTPANAGLPITVCDFPTTKSVLIHGNLDPARPYETGQWSVVNYPAGSIIHIPASATSATTLFSFDVAGIYTLLWTIKNNLSPNCPPTTSVLTITVTPTPISAFVASPAQVCAGEYVHVTNQSSNADPTAFTWIWGDVTPNSTFISGQHRYSLAGNYTIRLVAKNAACSDTSFKSVIVVNKIPAQIYVSPIATCIPYSLVFQALSATGANYIKWEFFDHLQPGYNVAYGTPITHDYTSAGVDSVRLIVSSSTGCIDSVSYVVTSFNKPAFSEALLPISTCAHDTTIKLLANASYTGSDPLTYTWYIDSVLVGSGNPYFYHLLTPLYAMQTYHSFYAIVHNTFGCADTSALQNIVIKPLPNPTISVDTFVRYQPNYTFNFSDTASEGNYARYLWSYGDGYPAINDGRRTSYTYRDTGTYKVTLLVTNDSTNCYGSNSIFVAIHYVSGHVDVPNIFSPSSDINVIRTFKPIGTGLLTYHFQIFDGLGKRIFESFSLTPDGKPAVGWDGTFNGKPMPQDAYAWRLEASFKNNPNKRIDEFGRVTLLH